jgi:hypothetical protein
MQIKLVGQNWRMSGPTGGCTPRRNQYRVGLSGHIFQCNRKSYLGLFVGLLNAGAQLTVPWMPGWASISCYVAA